MSTAVATERVPLSFLLAQNASEEPPVEPVLPFAAWREMAGLSLPITVTGLMERTAAFFGDGGKYDTGVLRLDLVYVDPTEVKWQASVGPRQLENGQPDRRSGQHWRTYRNNAPPAEDQRQRSDDRALANRADVQRAHDLERRQLAAQRVSTPTKPEPPGAFMGDPIMPTGTLKPETAAKPKTCTVCGKEKPRADFPPTGVNARRCFECAAIAAETEPAPKPKKARTIPAESNKGELVALSPTMPVASNGLGGTGFAPDALVEQIKNLIAERNTLRAQLDAIEAALVHA